MPDLRSLFQKRELPDFKCLQCGLLPGREYMASTDDPIMHPHECSWCKSVVYMPGLMLQCPVCSPDANAA